MDLNNITKQEIRIMIGGLESRNRHNIDVINGRKNVPKGMIKVCIDECNKIENLKAKLENILRSDDKEEQINTKEFEESFEKFKEVFNEMINRIKIATEKIKESNVKRNQGGVNMSEVVSLVDTDVVIVQARCGMNDTEIKEQEEKLTEKLGKKVVILPQQFDLLEYKDTNKQTVINADGIKINNNDRSNIMDISHGGISVNNGLEYFELNKNQSVFTLPVTFSLGRKNGKPITTANYIEDLYERVIENLDKKIECEVIQDSDKIEEFIKEQLEDIKAGIENVASKVSEPKYKVLNKEDYIKRKVDRVMKHQEEMWNKVSKGGKYVIYTEDSDNKTHYYSLDYFYNKPILGCNISK